MKVVKMSKTEGITIQITREDIDTWIMDNTVAEMPSEIELIYEDFFEAAKDPIRVGDALKAIEDAVKTELNMAHFELEADAGFLVE